MFLKNQSMTPPLLYIILHRSSIFTAKKEDPTQLLTTFKATGFSGIISLLYGILLHGGNPPRGSTATPPELPEHTLNVVNAGIKMLSNIAVLDLEMMQVIEIIRPLCFVFERARALLRQYLLG